jgi:CheY-like chemotaxis protein
MTARILVVDDIPANVKLLEVRLLAEYFEVLTATSGPEAIETCENGKIDVVLLDVMMPGMDGFEVAERVAKMGDIPGLTILMLSSAGRRVTGTSDYKSDSPDLQRIYRRHARGNTADLEESNIVPLGIESGVI